MTTALARTDGTAPLAIQPGQEMWTDKQRAALAVLGIKDCDNASLAVFMHYCQKTQLDPFSRQIYYIKRQDKWTIQVGIDGFRVMRDRVADRTGFACEFEDTVWYDDKGGEHAVWLSDEAPAACKVVLIKRQKNLSLNTLPALRFSAVLRTRSYMQFTSQGLPASQWKSQPEHMIEKCCEAFATRRAFPNDFSGVYLEEELQGRTADPPAPVRRVTAGEVLGRGEPASEPVAKLEEHAAARDDPAEPAPAPVTAQMVNDQFKRLGYGVKDKAEVLKAAAAIAGRRLPLTSIGELTGDQLTEVHSRLQGCADRDAVNDLWALITESQGGQDDGGTDG